MTESRTTSNGHEIRYSREMLSLDELKGMAAEYGLKGENPTERVEALQQMPADSIAMLMSDINRRAQGSEESLVSEKTVKVGEDSTIAPEDRYDLFTGIVDDIHKAPEGINPERVGDALALTTVLLHPFKDGNGRTARLMALMFHEGFDGADGPEDFATLVTPRDAAREAGGYIINGYIPYLPEGGDRSNPQEVRSYISDILTSPEEGLYTGPYGDAQLMAGQVQATPAAQNTR